MRGSEAPVLARAGADSLAADRLGCFNLSLDGHAEAVRFMRKFGVPMLVTGGAPSCSGPVPSAPVCLLALHLLC